MPAQPGPEDAVRGIVRAFDRHSVVIIGEAHWLSQTRDLYIGLVRDPEFQAKVNDIVVEFGSRNNQPVLDRYISGGNVPFAEFCRVWRDTTKVASWESPIYQEWLAAIREVNRKLPAGRRLRVLAGDTPVDWSRMQTHDDWMALGENNVSIAQVIGEQVSKHRKLLVVLGTNHVTRNGDRNHDADTTTRVEQAHPGSTYVVLLYDLPQMAAWKAPSVHALQGAPLAAVKDAKGDRLDRLADALLYLGPKSAQRMVKPGLSSIDAAYLQELERRSLIEWGRPFQKELFFGVEK
ncbi:conserved hypothetical protein [Candidatus Sulfopaludibacter sp. SbA4]|nr:conserved hypothetical protein [Candidatus Sulfopaludibacter sp. SbA4]